jgi:hypothetical protein
MEHINGSGLAALGAIAVFVATAAAEAQMSAEPRIVRVTVGPADLTEAGRDPNGDAHRYGLGFPFQVGPSLAGLFCNRRVEGKPVIDYENGTDVVLFDDLTRIRGDAAIPVSRNDLLADAATGARRVVVKYPVIGGFVPAGALQEDGAPHPHAGTGFGICQAISFPLDADGIFNWDAERKHRLEVLQFGFDGTAFHSMKQTADGAPDHPEVIQGGWRIQAPGITNAIPDGLDLLQPAMGNRDVVTVSGVIRWQRPNRVWTPVSFDPVTPERESWSEASMVRASDGGLLFSARGYGADRINMVRVWRRAKGTALWQMVLEAPKVRHEAPVSLNQAADGTPYIGACLLGHGRETLCLWPLAPDCNELLNAMVVRNAKGEFGVPPGGQTWMVDHPSSAVLRLADGDWHNVLAYRILQYAEFKGKAPAPQSGCYVEEVVSRGKVLPPWRFE